MQRRDVLRRLSAGTAAAAGAGLFTRLAREAQQAPPPAPATPPAPRGLPVIRIKDVKTILTAPNRIRLVVVKVMTDQPGLYGWGCATFTQRALVVQTAIDQYLKPFLIGRPRRRDRGHLAVDRTSARTGATAPVLYNAISGVDMALWDILGKRAGLPLYQLLGGKVPPRRRLLLPRQRTRLRRRSRTTPARASQQGFRHVRVQVGVPGLATYGARSDGAGGRPTAAEPIGPTSPRDVWEPAAYVRMLPKLFEHLRTQAGRRGRAAARRARARASRSRRSTCARRSSRTTCSSSRTRSARRTSAGSGSCASRPAPRSRWASCSTTGRSTCR